MFSSFEINDRRNIEESGEIKKDGIEGQALSNTSTIEFNPVSHGLDADFRLTKFSPIHKFFDATNCEVSQDTRNKLVEALNQNSEGTSDASRVHSGTEHLIQTGTPRLHSGMDCCVIPFEDEGRSLIQTTDFSYPVCDDPYTMGRITCANVLSDLYAMGVTKCDNMHILLGISNEMKEKEREVVIHLIMKGFQDCAVEAETTVDGFKTVPNPWLIIGGVATTVCAQHELRMPSNAEVGDSLILTKPLGTEIAVTAYQLHHQPMHWDTIKLAANKEYVQKTYRRAIDTMSSLNRTAAQLMQSHDARGATDIARYGLLVHANNLARIQKNEVSFLINKLPVIANTPYIGQFIPGLKYHKLTKGRSFETSSGLLICLPTDKVESYCSAFSEKGGKCWVIGTVEAGDRTAKILKPEFIQFPEEERDDELW